MKNERFKENCATTHRVVNVVICWIERRMKTETMENEIMIYLNVQPRVQKNKFRNLYTLRYHVIAVSCLFSLILSDAFVLNSCTVNFPANNPLSLSLFKLLSQEWQGSLLGIL